MSYTRTSDRSPSTWRISAATEANNYSVNDQCFESLHESITNNYTTADRFMSTSTSSKSPPAANLPAFESIFMESILNDLDDPFAPKSSSTIEIEAHNICYEAPCIASNVMGRLWAGSNLQCSTTADGTNPPPQSLILKHVSCIARPGEILAIAGPSGAGKSTLLEVLGGQRHPAAGSGKVLVNKQEVSAMAFRHISGFVPQSDVLFPRLTVWETLMFSASMRLSGSAADKAKKVTALIAELGLTHVADAMVGGENIRGISGGERRRVSIGVDVIHDPAVLLLDEPTSGLDSSSAYHVIRMLHNMAKMRSRTIILSIHQPGYRIIEQLNALLLLANGMVVHHGSLKMLHHRLRVGGHTIPAQVNILEYALEAISNGTLLAKSVPAASGFLLPPQWPFDMGSIRLLVDEFAHYEAACNIHQKTAPFSPELGRPSPVTAISTFSISSASSRISECSTPERPVLKPAVVEKPTFANSRWQESMILAQRFLRNLLRTRTLLIARMLHALGAGIGLGLMYNDVSLDEKGITERLGFFAFTLTFLISGSIQDLPIFLEERSVLVLETSRGAYRVSSYVLANLSIFVPFMLLLALLYSLPVYYIMGLSATTSAFLNFLWIVWVVLVMANSFVGFVSAMAPDFVLANSLIQGWIGASFLFSGYFISSESMPLYCRFMHYTSMFKYPLDGLLINEYSSLQAQGKCFDYDFSNAQEHEPSCSFSPLAVLQHLGLHQTPIWHNILIIIASLALFRILFYMILRMKASKRGR